MRLLICTVVAVCGTGAQVKAEPRRALGQYHGVLPCGGRNAVVTPFQYQNSVRKHPAPAPGGQQNSDRNSALVTQLARMYTRTQQLTHTQRRCAALVAEPTHFMTHKQAGSISYEQVSAILDCSPSLPPYPSHSKIAPSACCSA